VTHDPELVETGTVSAFLRYVHGAAIDAGVPGRVVVSEKMPKGWKPRYQSHSWPITEHYAAALECRAISNRGRNAFVRCHLIDREIEVYERGRTPDTRWITHYAADVDIAGLGHVATDLPESIEEAVAMVDATLAPSLIVSSGGGLYPIWKLSEVVEVVDDDQRERVRNVGRRIDAGLKSRGRHVDSTALDLCRIIRPPGVMNCKTSKPPRPPLPVEILRGAAAGAGTYTLEQLERLLPLLPAGTPSTREARPADRDGTRTESTARSGDTDAAWTVFERRYSLADVLRSDSSWSWEQVDDVRGEEAWRRVGSSSDYSIRRHPDTGAIVVWSSTVAERLRIDPGSALDLFGFAWRLAGRDPSLIGKKVAP